MDDNMIKIALRCTAMILLLIIIVMDDFPFYEKMKDSATQLFLAIIVVALIYYDTTFGFIMGLVLLLIYYEIYKKIIMNYEKKMNENLEQKPSSSQASSKHLLYNAYEPAGLSTEVSEQLNYISAEHLIAAQNNVFDIENYKTEVRGIEHGFNNEKVYGAQGLNSEEVNHIGYNREDLYATLK